MIELGTISVDTIDAILNGRRKLRQIGITAFGDELKATHLAAAVSTFCRSALATNELVTTSARVSLDPQRGHQVLIISIELMCTIGITESDKWIDGVADLNVLQDVCDEFHTRVDGHIADLNMRLQTRLAPTDLDEVEQIRSTCASRNRDELVAEVQRQNQELEKSMENLRQTRSDKERMEGELNVGHEIQMNMLPLTFPPFPDRSEFEVYAQLTPARQVGGDFYDFFFVDESHLCLIVGDVSGKGVPAALFMAVTKTLIKSKMTHGLTPNSVLSRVNDDLAIDNKTSMFVTLFAAILDLDNGQISYTNAGHNPPELLRADGDLIRLDQRHGLVLAAMEGSEYGEDTVGIDPGDTLLIYTDGVTEAMNRSEELFGEDRLCTVFQQRYYEDCKSLVETITSEVHVFEDGAEQADDVTVLAVRYFGYGEVPTIRLTIGNDLAELTSVVEAVNIFAAENDVPKVILGTLHMAFDEILNNSITYGFPDGGRHQINIHVELRKGEILVRISDDGEAFDPFSIGAPAIDQSLEDRQIGGMGIHLVRNMMDEVNYVRLNDRNLLTLRKKV